MNEREAVFQRRAAHLIYRGAPVYPSGVSDGTGMPWQRHSLAVELQRRVGGRLIHGWIIDRVTTVGRAMIALFHFQSVVLTPAGRHLDPNHLQNKAPRFLPDPDRPFDPTEPLTWNSIAIASLPIACLVTHREFPAMKPLWATQVCGKTAFSANPAHARRRMMADGEDCTAYVVGLGLDPTSMVDVSFATNIEFSLVAYVGKPASRVRGVRLTETIVPRLDPPSELPEPILSGAFFAARTAPQDHHAGVPSLNRRSAQPPRRRETPADRRITTQDGRSRLVVNGEGSIARS